LKSSAVLLTLLSLTATAAHADQDDSSDRFELAFIGASAQLDAEHRPLWRISMKLETEFALAEGSIFAQTSLALGTNLAVDLSEWTSSGVVSVTVPADSPQSGDVIVVNVYAGVDRSLLHRFGGSVYLRNENGTLSASSYDEWIEAARQTDLERPDLLGPAPISHRNAPPWDNPNILRADRAFAESIRDQLESEVALGEMHGALIGQQDSTVASRQSGCASSPATALWGLTFLCFGGLWSRRSRFTAIASLLLVGVALPMKADAVVAYGYVAFWDIRPDMSNATGSRLLPCNDTNTTCSVSDGASCCYRGVENLKISVGQSGTLLATADVNANGFYIINFTGNNLHSYQFFIDYERDFDPGTTILTTGATSTTPYRHYFGKLPGSVFAGHSYVNLEDFRVSARSDTLPAAGDYATSWVIVSDTQEAIAAEGDWRHRKLYGSSSSDPDDLIVIRHHIKSAWDCVNSEIKVNTAQARGLAPAECMGGLYHARVVGCDGDFYGTDGYSFASFPPNPGMLSMPGAGSESVAMHRAFHSVVAILSRWNRTYASRADIQSVSGRACVTDSLANSNDAAWDQNTLLGMWEWLDADPAGTDGSYADSCSISLKDLMDGLYWLSISTPLPPYFIVNNTSYEPDPIKDVPCTPSSSNEQCDQGDACTVDELGLKYCASGDPHGGNLADLAVRLTTGAGCNYLQTLMSSPCVGAADNTYPFTGGYRTD